MIITASNQFQNQIELASPLGDLPSIVCPESYGSMSGVPVHVGSWLPCKLEHAVAPGHHAVIDPFACWQNKHLIPTSRNVLHRCLIQKLGLLFKWKSWFPSIQKNTLIPAPKNPWDSMIPWVQPEAIWCAMGWFRGENTVMGSSGSELFYNRKKRKSRVKILSATRKSK